MIKETSMAAGSAYGHPGPVKVTEIGNTDAGG